MRDTDVSFKDEQAVFSLLASSGGVDETTSASG
jgi:hypothetical protein